MDLKQTLEALLSILLVVALAAAGAMLLRAAGAALGAALQGLGAAGAGLGHGLGAIVGAIGGGLGTAISGVGRGLGSAASGIGRGIGSARRNGGGHGASRAKQRMGVGLAAAGAVGLYGARGIGRAGRSIASNVRWAMGRQSAATDGEQSLGGVPLHAGEEAEEIVEGLREGGINCYATPDGYVVIAVEQAEAAYSAMQAAGYNVQPPQAAGPPQVASDFEPSIIEGEFREEATV